MKHQRHLVAFSTYVAGNTKGEMVKKIGEKTAALSNLGPFLELSLYLLPGLHLEYAGLLWGTVFKLTA